MPLPQLAAKLMSELFTPEYTPRGGAAFSSAYEPYGGFVDLEQIARPLLPNHSRPKIRDPITDAEKTLRDIAAEAIQLLEHAALIMPDHADPGQTATFGYRTTRAGRAALEQGTVAQILTGAN